MSLAPRIPLNDWARVCGLVVNCILSVYSTRQIGRKSSEILRLGRIAALYRIYLRNWRELVALQVGAAANNDRDRICAQPRIESGRRRPPTMQVYAAPEPRSA